MRIEPERAENREAVALVIARAFGRPDEALLVEALRRDSSMSLSLVAWHDEAIVGHIAFQPVRVDGRTAISAASLAPISVVPEHQKHGIGSALIQAGLDQLRSRQTDIVFVLGDPAYYGRFGFSAKAAEGYVSPWPAPYFQALRLNDAAKQGGTLIYPQAFFGGIA